MNKFDCKFQAEIWIEKDEDDMIQPLLNGFHHIYEGVLNTNLIEELQKDLFDNNYDQFIAVNNGSWILVDISGEWYQGEGDNDSYYEFTYTNIKYLE
jgi:hypothetical protein